MIAGKKYVGPMADIWSMGVILFALVCGYLPFEDPNTALLYKKILSGDYKPPKWISPEAKDLIRCILEVDPRKRYTMADIRKHPWYNLVPETAIPKEITNESEDEILRAETLKLLSTNGMDMQALLDGLASHACNALTATYYLFEQRARTSRMKNPQLHSSSQPPHHHHSHETNISSKDQQKENNSNNNNHAENNEAHRPKSNPHPETNAPLHGSIKNNHNANANENQIVKPSPLHGANIIPVNPPEHGSSHKNNGHPVILPSTTAAMNHNHQNNNTNTNTIAPISPRSPVSNKNNITPYLQTPQILQQARQIEKQQQQQQQSHHHQQQQQSQNANGASPTSTQENADMPSLDYYMKTGLTLTIGGGANNNNENNSNQAVVNGKPKPAPEIPKLVLKNKNTVIPPIQRPGVTILDPQTNRVEDPLMSQTARLPAATKTTVNNDSLNLSLQPLSMKTGGGVQLNPIMPQSARAVLESIPKNYNQTVSSKTQQQQGGENSPQKQNPHHQKNLSLDDQENPPLIEAVRPPPEFLAEGYDTEGRGRPNTRRSRMRSRGGENPPEEEPQHFEPLPAEGLLEMDEIPVPLDHNILHVKATPPQNNNNNLLKQPIVAVRAPDGLKPTAATAAAAAAGGVQGAAGGRRGKNLVQSTPVQGSEINETKPLVAVQPVPPVALKPSAPAGPSQQQSVPLKPVRPAPPTQVAPPQQAVHLLPAGVPPDSSAFNNNRQEANKNKMAAQGTLRF
jgi:hypothetical protein